MKVLFLGPRESPLISWLKSQSEDVIATEDPIDLSFLGLHRPDFIVSYGYRHIIRNDVLTRYRDRAINLHISLLPWNRGADPNLWSVVEDTPKGVTIHYLDKGVDTGEIIAQREVALTETDTLRTSYEKLQAAIQALFKDIWADLRAGRAKGKPQQGAGSYHRLKDKEKIAHLLTAGWDTPISTLRKRAG